MNYWGDWVLPEVLWAEWSGFKSGRPALFLPQTLFEKGFL